MNAKNRLGGTGHVINDSANHLADRLRNASLVQRIEQSQVIGNCIGFSNSYDMNTYCYKITDCSITSIYKSSRFSFECDFWIWLCGNDLLWQFETKIWLTLNHRWPSVDRSGSCVFCKKMLDRLLWIKFVTANHISLEHPVKLTQRYISIKNENSSEISMS